MSQIDPQGAAVIALARSGDLKGAIAAGEAVLARGVQDAPLTLFVGMLCCRQGDLDRGIPHLRRAVELAPREAGAKVELARALIAAGANAEAEAVATPLASLATPGGREMQRIQAHAQLRQGQVQQAVTAFDQLVKADNGDFESWDGLGTALLAGGDPPNAIVALQRATLLRPSAIAYWINLSRAHAAMNDFAAGMDAAQMAVGRAPGVAAGHLELARSLAGLRRYDEAQASLVAARSASSADGRIPAEMLAEIGDAGVRSRAFEAAEADFRAALALRTDLPQAWIGLGKLLERLNRTRELLDLIVEAEAAGVPAEAMALLRARALRGEGQFEEALAAARLSPDDVDQVDRAQLIGDLADRVGDADTAFAAFAEANAILAATTAGSLENAESYLEKFGRVRDLLTFESHSHWSPAEPPGSRRAPLFIFGFPRSGTTLIDTMLSGHPDAVVMEEEPVIDRVSQELGRVERLATLSPAEIEDLRALYFREVDKVVPDAGDRLIVDKNPLGLSSTPLLHRLFPDARFVFVERHPCDVVLSCFITSSRMNSNIASFFDFVGTARLYDRVLAFWERCREVLPIAVHTIRYESLIVDPETELRQLAAFAGLDWNPRLLANQSNATARSYIGSPSYAQVAEPIYARASGRWLKYRHHMDAVIPILQPWISHLRYDRVDS